MTLLLEFLPAGIAFWIVNSAVTTGRIDYNRDGFLDEKWIYKGDRPDKDYQDRNFDKTKKSLND